MLVLVEFACYAISLWHIFHHDNYVAVKVLSQSVIKQRNRTNAISMVGLFVSWSWQVLQIVLSGFVVTMFDLVWFREYSSLLRTMDFVLIPWIQINTSPPLKQYKEKKSKQS